MVRILEPAACAIPTNLRRFAWILVSVELVWGVCLALILTQALPCAGLACRVATLGHHTAVLLGFAAVCTAGLVGIAVTTRGFAKGNGWEVGGLAVAGAAGGWRSWASLPLCSVWPSCSPRSWPSLVH